VGRKINKIIVGSFSKGKLEKGDLGIEVKDFISLRRKI
jgi:hypothetical protein